MNMNRIDVLAVMDRSARSISAQSKLSDDGAAFLSDDVQKARAAVAELIEAARDVRDAGSGDEDWARLDAAIARVAGEP